jgi:D-alanyl-lipoteichoic acid acyltransferase DltB (MBOAT superfamily)
MVLLLDDVMNRQDKIACLLYQFLNFPIFYTLLLLGPIHQHANIAQRVHHQKDENKQKEEDRDPRMPMNIGWRLPTILRIG